MTRPTKSWASARACASAAAWSYGRAIDPPAVMAMRGVVVIVAVRRPATDIRPPPTRAPSSRGRPATAPVRRRWPAGADAADRPLPTARSAPRTRPARPRPPAADQATARARTRAARIPPPQPPNRRRCDATPVCTWRSIPESVATSGSTAWVADDVHVACRPSAASRPPSVASICASRAAASAYCAADRSERRGQPRLPGRLQLGDVAPVRLGPDLVQERQAALHRSRMLELVGQHRRQRQGERRRPLMTVEHIQQRQIRRRNRLPQPLLAERPGAEPLDVGHVGVQDDRQFARGHLASLVLGRIQRHAGQTRRPRRIRMCAALMPGARSPSNRAATTAAANARSSAGSVSWSRRRGGARVAQRRRLGLRPGVVAHESLRAPVVARRRQAHGVGLRSRRRGNPARDRSARAAARSRWRRSRA